MNKVYILLYVGVIQSHCGSFRYIPLPSLFMSFLSGVIPFYTGIFRSIPFLCSVTPVNTRHKKAINQVYIYIYIVSKKEERTDNF